MGASPADNAAHNDLMHRAGKRKCVQDSKSVHHDNEGNHEGLVLNTGIHTALGTSAELSLPKETACHAQDSHTGQGREVLILRGTV